MKCIEFDWLRTAALWGRYWISILQVKQLEDGEVTCVGPTAQTWWSWHLHPGSQHRAKYPLNISSIILGLFMNFPTHFCTTKFLFKQRSGFYATRFGFTASQGPIFLFWCIWQHHRAPSTLRCRWSPPSAGSRWAERHSEARSLICHTPAGSLEWSSAPA